MTADVTLRLGESDFTLGRATFRDEHHRQTGEGPRIWLEVRPRGLPSLYAILDTGSPYCVVDQELANALGLNPAGQEVVLKSAYGPLRGRLDRLWLTILAHDGETPSRRRALVKGLRPLLS